MVPMEWLPCSSPFIHFRLPRGKVGYPGVSVSKYLGFWYQTRPQTLNPTNPLALTVEHLHLEGSGMVLEFAEGLLRWGLEVSEP